MFADLLIHVATGIGKALGDVGDTLHTAKRKETPIVVVGSFCRGQPGLSSLADLGWEIIG